jgi:dipeptidyl aminopeptidase/acylaminoacyl peptidase
MRIHPLALLLLAARIAAQAPRPAAAASFTPEDALDITSYQPNDLTADGRWLVATSSVRRDGFGADFRRDGDPTYVRPNAVKLWVIDTRSGGARAVYADKRNLRSPRWSPDGSRLAFLELVGESYVPVIWDRASGRLSTAKVPAGRYVAENSDVRWTDDGTRLVFSLHTNEWRTKARETFASMTNGPVFVQSSKEPFLSWEALRRLGSQVTVVAYNTNGGSTEELIPWTTLGSFDITEDGSVVVYNEDVTKKTDYDVIFGTERTLIARRLSCSTECTRTILPSLKNTTIAWARDNKRFAYSKEGRVFVGTIDDTAKKLIAGLPVGERRDTADTSKAARERREKERFAVERYSPSGDAVVISSKEGLWLYDVNAGTKELIVATSDSSPALPRVRLEAWSDDGKQLYFTSASKTQWQRAILKYDRTTKKLDELAKDGRFYTGLRLSKDGSTLVLNIGNGNRPADLYVADANLRNARRLVETNPQLASKKLARTDLLTYLDSDGHKKYGVVYYPADYTVGKTAPTVFNVYEDFFDDTFDANANILASSGYVVVKPSVDFDIGYPGEAWVKGVTSAANKLIEMGVADSTRLGVHGQSYGGYATNLLITQTQRFRAAINISGKVDVISFYTDSPRLGVRNVHAAEKSQDRLGATLWQQPQKYVQHSAIMFADRITTPLLLITGAQDSNVPADNTREMYYALRRLGKEVVWVNYMNGGHGGGNATVGDFLDMQRRIIEWYDAKLKRPDEKVASR